MGSGTTAVAALRTQRHFVGYETDPAYVLAARQRVETERQLLEQESQRDGYLGPPAVRRRCGRCWERRPWCHYTRAGARYVLLITEKPPAKSTGGHALAAVTGTDPTSKPVYDVIGLRISDDLDRLRLYGRGRPAPRG